MQYIFIFNKNKIRQEKECTYVNVRNVFQVFSEAKIFFSVGGRYYNGEPITYSYIEDRIFENSRNVSIKLHHRVGKYVKLQLYFAAKWIMISEVVFESGKTYLIHLVNIGYITLNVIPGGVSL